MRPTEMRPDNQIDWDSCLRAPLEFSQKARARLKNGDVLIAVKGATIASKKSVCMVRNLSEPTIVNGSIFHFQPKKEADSEFLLEVLSSDFVKKQMKQGLILNNAVDYLSRTIIDDFLIPLPSLDDQRTLVAKMEAARQQRQEMLAEAQALLHGIDEYFLEAIDFEQPKEDTQRVYAAKVVQLSSTKRLDPDYFHPERIGAIRSLEKHPANIQIKRLSDIVDFIRSQDKVSENKTYLSLGNIESNTGLLVDSSRDQASGTCSIFMKNDILFARLRPYLNKVYRAEFEGTCSTEFHVMRLGNAEIEIIPDYLATVLRSSLTLMQTRHMMTGNTHPRLANEDVVDLWVPIPNDLTLQKKIVDEIQLRRVQANQLRTEAEALWQTAKDEFEKALLG